MTNLFNTDDTYQCGAEFDVGYMNASMDRFKAEVHKLFTDKFNGIPGVQTLQETLLRFVE